MKKIAIWTFSGGVFTIAMCLPAFCPHYYLSLTTEMLIFAMFAMSLNLLLGYTGLPNFGHAAFFGLGSYVIAISSTRWIVNFWLNLTLALGITGIVAIICGLLCLRTRGHYFILITISLGQVLWGVAWRWRSLTNGDDGISGIPYVELASWSLTDALSFYYFALGWFVVLCLLLVLNVHSPFGKALVGTRENESRMRALGYNTWLYKLTAFVLAGIYAGLAGALFAYHTRYVHPSNLSLMLSGECLLMVILGGSGTFFGPVLGACIVVYSSNIVSTYTDRWPLILGFLYVLVVFFAPRGILGFLKEKRRS